VTPIIQSYQDAMLLDKVPTSAPCALALCALARLPRRLSCSASEREMADVL
jgi:hypothetical protein